MSLTIYDKIWNDHLVHRQEDGTSLLFVDRHLIHEVTSPQAFESLRNSKRKVRQPKLTLAVADHNVPTTDRSKGIADEDSKIQFFHNSRAGFKAKLKQSPALYSQVHLAEFTLPDELTVDEPVDRILTFRNIHNWYMNGGGEARVEQAFKAFYEKLKPGGVLGVVEHRLPPERSAQDQEKSGYMLEKDILEKYKEPCPEALVESAQNNIKMLEDENFFNFKISVKSSDVFLATKAYRALSKVCDYPLHLGITEAGSLTSGSIKSSIGMGILLMEGIGDTIRVSLSANPVEEVKIGYEILKSLNLRHKGVNIISCPSCARQGFPVIDTVKILEEKLSHIKEPITLSIIGCVVNGPGEASQTQIGLTGGGKNDHMMYLSGLPHHKVASEKIIEEVISLVENKSIELKSK